jgi:hypothetical protein
MFMDWSYIIENWPVWAVLTIILLVNTLPKIVQFMGGSVVPVWSQERLANIERQHRLDDDERIWKREELEAERELRERQVLADEKIARTLTLLEANGGQQHEDHKLMISALASINTTLALLADRALNRREICEGDSQ